MLITCTSETTVSEISSNGVTWTFDDTYETGQFVTGDWWVVAPTGLTITEVSPGWDGAKHGSMVNPAADITEQGYDSRCTSFTYNGASRAVFPLDLSAGDSLVSTIGKTTPASGGGATKISAAAVLTVLATAPAANAFRPPYVGTDKTIWTTDDVDYGLLPGLATPSGATLIDMTASGDYLNKVWLSHGNKRIGYAEIHPEDHMGGASASARGYGFEMAKRMSHMAVACLLDIPEANSIANRLIQYGIDQQASMAGNGTTWSRNGGHGWGHKWPILFAKLMLSETWSIPYYVTGSSGELKFQEDAYTYAGDTVARWGEACSITGTSTSGSNNSCRDAEGDDDQYELAIADGVSGGYEVSVGARCMIGQTLAARQITGAKTAWGHDPAFDYADRWVTSLADTMAATNASSIGLPISLGNTFQIDVNKYGGTGNGFMKLMYETYGP